MTHVFLTLEEQKAIRSLERLAKKWPESLHLFSWSGALVVTKLNDEGVKAVVGGIAGIANDGGDPGSDEIEQCPKIEYEQVVK